MSRRRGKESKKPDSQGWLVTFSDLVTLLLTFFVLLLSMSTLDKKIITVAFSHFTEKIAFISAAESGKIPSEIRLVKETLQKPWEILEKKEQIKDLLFPDESLPPGINKSTLERNLQVLQRPEGVALVLSDQVLFHPGSSELKANAGALLDRVRTLLLTLPAPVNVSGHTDSTGGPGVNNYQLAAERAKAVLLYLLERDLDPDRFSISAYGPDSPVASNQNPQGRQKNRRVEILLKTKPYSKTYL